MGLYDNIVSFFDFTDMTDATGLVTWTEGGTVTNEDGLAKLAAGASLTCDDPAVLDIGATGDFSFFCRVKFLASTGNNYIAKKTITVGGTPGWSVRLTSGGSIIVLMRDSDGNEFTSETFAADTVEGTACFTFERDTGTPTNGTLKYYFNGSLTDTNNFTNLGSLANADDLEITAVDEFHLNEWVCWNRALSAAEVTEAQAGMVYGILNPDNAKIGMVDDAGELKPGLVNGTYTSGPAVASQLKPGLVTPAGELKPGIANSDGTLRDGAAR